MRPRPPRQFDRAVRNTVIDDLVARAAAAGVEPHPSFAAELVDFTERMAMRPLEDPDVRRVLDRLGYATILDAVDAQTPRIGAKAVAATAMAFQREPRAAMGDVARDILGASALDEQIEEMRAALEAIQAKASPRPRRGVRQEARGFDPATRDAIVQRLEDFAMDARRDVRDSFADELIDYSERIGVRALSARKMGIVLGTITCDVLSRAPAGETVGGGEVRSSLLRLCPDPFSTCRAAAGTILKLAPGRADVQQLGRRWLADVLDAGDRDRLA